MSATPNLVSPSALALQALGLPAEAAGKVPTDCRCSVCGTRIAAGDPADPMDLPGSFTNHNALAHPGGEWRCAACATVMGRKEFQMGWSTALICRDGYFPIIRKENRAWAFIDPPAPPFAICIQNAQQQHTVWRAPVSLSRDIFFVRIGEQVVRIRREKLLAARQTALMLNAKREEMVAAGKGKRSRVERADPESPFVNDWKMQSATGGQRKPWVEKLVETGFVAPQDLAPLECLNGGEAWALNAVLHSNPVRPPAATATTAADTTE